MIFLADQSNLNSRRLLTRIHQFLQSCVADETSPVEHVWYHTSTGNKAGVRATLTPDQFLQSASPNSEAELQISFDFPKSYSYDFYTIQWIESDRTLMLGWHQDETHMDLGECHFQLDYQGSTVQRVAAPFLDAHPLNVLDQRITDLVGVLAALTWDEGVPRVHVDAVQ